MQSETITLAQVALGLFGGAGATLLWELILKPRRERQAVAGALFAELLRIEQYVKAFLERSDRSRFPTEFHVSTFVFDSLTSRIGELHLSTLAELVGVYAKMHELNRIPAIARTLANEIREDSTSHRASLLRAELHSTTTTFYDHLSVVHGAIHSAAAQVGTDAFRNWRPWRSREVAVRDMERAVISDRAGVNDQQRIS
jgi:hypothetical protein